ncbi:MAG TPA: nuclear transport factor 2 family protein [Streptosporangiaceae bacterium]|jgi:ketosteroid isomerase-like protein
MPWFPDFVSAVQLARQQTRAAGQADPVTQYFDLLNSGDTRALETVWPGEITVFDPLAGEIRGHRELHRFVRKNQSWLGGLQARAERVASVAAGQRAVVELLAHATQDGRELPWPIAVAAESDGRSVQFRTYCRVWPITGPHRVRPAILPPGPDRPGDVVARYLSALAAGDAEAAVGAFSPGGYYRESGGSPELRHQGAAELRAFFARQFSAGGGIGLQCCAVTDDGVRCALEYTCVRWGSHELPPQAGIAVCERGPDGLLAAVRVYDDIAAPAGS